MIPYLLLAIILRIIPLGESLWLDESIQALALRGQMGPILSYALSDFQPPLYHLILLGWTYVFGTSEIMLRLPSFIAGVLVVYIGSLVAKELSSGNRRVQLVAGFLLATNPLLVYYSVEGRTYMMTTLFVVLSLYTLLTKKQLGLLFSTIGVVWTSYLGSIFVLAESIYLLIKKEYKQLGILILGQLSLLLWLPSFFSSLQIGLSTLTSSPGWGNVVGSFEPKALALTFVKFAIGRISFDNNYLYLAICIFILLIHALFFLRKTSSQVIKSNILLLLTFTLPIIIGYLISSFIPIYQYFRVLFTLPIYLVTLALLSKDNRRNAAIGLILVQVFFVFFYYFSPRFQRENWRQVVRDYGANSYYALPSLNQNAPLLYYLVPRDHILEPKTLLKSDASEIIYIKYAEEIFDQAGLGRARLIESGYTMAKEHSYSGLSIEVYRR